MAVKYFVVLIVGLCCLHYSTEQRVVSVGSEIKSTRAGHPGGAAIFLLETPVQKAGRLFAFSAFFRNGGKVRFQMWRPVVSENVSMLFRLISETPMIPSVEFDRENLYIESLLKTDECIHVKVGDHFGVFLEEAPGSIGRTFSPNSDTRVLNHHLKNDSLLTHVGDDIEFDALVFPYEFSMAAYIDTEIENVTSDPNTNFMPCPIGLLIPKYNQVTLPPTVSTPPPTGAPGATGPQGPRGATGKMGPAGEQGEIGPPGVQGAIGPIGPVGPVGANGSDGVDGQDGAPGAQGIRGVPGPIGPRGYNGSVGPQGEMGEQGATGKRGPAGKDGEDGEDGEDGKDGKDGKNAPGAEASKDEGFWEKWEVVRGLAIWLLVVSIVVVVLFIFLICIACIMCRRRRRDKSHRYDYDEYMTRHKNADAATIPPYENVNAEWVNSLRADEYKDMTVDTITRDGARRNAPNIDPNPSPAGAGYNVGTNRSSNGHGHTNPGLVSADEIMNY